MSKHSRTETARRMISRRDETKTRRVETGIEIGTKIGIGTGKGIASGPPRRRAEIRIGKGIGKKIEREIGRRTGSGSAMESGSGSGTGIETEGVIEKGIGVEIEIVEIRIAGKSTTGMIKMTGIGTEASVLGQGKESIRTKNQDGLDPQGIIGLFLLIAKVVFAFFHIGSQPTMTHRFWRDWLSWCNICACWCSAATSVTILTLIDLCGNT